jgi:hypothetical protein
MHLREISKLLPTPVLVCILIAAALFGLIRVEQTFKVANSEIVFLLPEHTAQWIRFDRPFDLQGRQSSQEITAFRYNFSVKDPTLNAALTVRALRQARIFLDGKLLHTGEDGANWKDALNIPLPGHWSPGTHELKILVRDQNGPPLLLAYSKQLNIFTGPDWQATKNNTQWSQSVTVDKRLPLESSLEFPSSFEAFTTLLLPMTMLFFLIFYAVQACERDLVFADFFRQVTPTPKTLRLLLIAAWLLMSINNIFKLPLYVGFDVANHLDYIKYVASAWTIPLASEGGQMFQAPLYYIVSTALAKFLVIFFEPKTSLQLLRCVPLFCGLIQIELCYRVLKMVFPKQAGLQCLGLLLGALLPMNIYMSQYLGNEPLAACLSALTLVLVIQQFHHPQSVMSWRHQSLIGLALGLALLSKMTAFLLVPLVLAAQCYSARQFKLSLIARSLIIILLVAFLVAGWFYIRNWLLLGKPFVGGWDAARGHVWWQDPGYRTALDFLSFGQALVHPVHAMFAGFWDGFYATLWLDGFLSSVITFEGKPPWNYNFVLAAPLFALLPSFAIIIGAGATLWRSADTVQPAQLLSIACVSLYLLAVAYLFFSLPIYTTIKASYTLGLIPCFALLGCAGFDLLSRNVVAKGVVYAGMACWACQSYMAYFIL